VLKGTYSSREADDISNLAFIGGKTNRAISDKPPAKYLADLIASIGEVPFQAQCIPTSVTLLEKENYKEFLVERRRLIAVRLNKFLGTTAASVAGEAKGSLSDDGVAAAQLIAKGETARVEFKSTLRVNLHTGQPDKKMEQACLKTITAFLNSHGGYLLIGVNDGGKALGIENDGFPNEDKMNLHLVNLIKDRMGAQHMLHIEPRFESLDGKRVLVVHCKPSNVPVYLKDGNSEQFYTRTGAATTELPVSQIQTYIQQRF
jgi:hypothetical protein